MGSSSDTSSEEQVKEETTTTNTTTTTKRSYECNFCKRGFTNAQALGGHMNIHRKDRAKTKQISSSSSSSISPKISTNEEYVNPNFMGHIPSTEPIRNYYPILEAQRNYHPHHMYFQPQDYLYHSSDHSVVPKNNNEQLWGANLSLQIGSNHLEDQNNQVINRDVSKEDDEVDLELRLGHDHMS